MVPTRIAHDGTDLPIIGFGTWTVTGATGALSLRRAIQTGYTLLDSAVNYENEGAVGWAVRTSSVPREGLIVTSKLPGRHHVYAEAVACVQESVYRTGLDYLDLYLIHWPNPLEDRYVEAWQALIEAREQGLIKAIGVSNFMPEHIERLQRETGVLPAVNQIELHPYFPQAEALAFHTAHGILTEAWSPLGRGRALLNDPVILEIARKHGVTPGQTVLAWHIARGAIPLPRAASVAHQQENLDAVAVQLPADAVAAITALGGPDGRLADQDPARHQQF